jgi:hypothetical protein
VAGGAGVTDARYEELMAQVSGTGRVAYNPSSATLSQGIVYADSTGRQVKVRGNVAAIVRGFRWETDAAGLLQPIDANTSGQTRIDLAVLRLNRETYTVSFRIVKGTPSTTPVPPTPVQTTGATTYEWPVATIRVTSSASSGLPSIGLADVTVLDTFIAQTPMTGHSSRRPPAAYGGLWTEYDTGRTYVGMGGSWVLIGEAGDLTRLGVNSTWEQPGQVWAARRNGFVYLQGVVQWNSTTRSAGTDLTICTIPDTYRPATGDLYVDFNIDTGHLGRGYIDASTGRLYIYSYGVSIASGVNVSVHPVTYPAK